MGLLSKELKYLPQGGYLQRHPRLQPTMRAILLDWLLEVSEVYSLHRQTAYLAQDFFDRFMLTQEDVSKEHLQLLGITALFIAAKIEVSLAPPTSPTLDPPPGTGTQKAPFCSSGDLPSEDLRVRLRDGRRLRHVGHPADGAAHAEGEDALTLVLACVCVWGEMLSMSPPPAGAGVEPVPGDAHLLAEAVRSGGRPDGRGQLPASSVLPRHLHPDHAGRTALKHASFSARGAAELTSDLCCSCWTCA